MTSPFEVNIKAEDINKMVTQAILDSSIGANIKKAVEEEASKLSRSYDNPIKKAVEIEYLKIIAQVIKETYENVMREKVKEFITDEIVGEVLRVAFDTYTDKMWKVRG